MKHTLSTNSQAEINYLTASQSIIDLFSKLKFTSEIKVDYVNIRSQIVKIIRNNIEGNDCCGGKCGCDDQE